MAEPLPGCLDGGSGGGDLTGGEDATPSLDTLSLSEMEGMDLADDMLDLESLLVGLLRRGGGGGGFMPDVSSEVCWAEVFLFLVMVASL